MQSFVGIDVSKSKLDVCVIIENSKIRKKVVKNSKLGFVALKNWLMKFNLQDPHICMEATGCYSEGVATFFHDLIYEEIPHVYADHYESYKEFSSKGNLTQSKKYTPPIERNNGRQRHWLAAFRRSVTRSITNLGLIMALFARFRINLLMN